MELGNNRLSLEERKIQALEKIVFLLDTVVNMFTTAAIAVISTLLSFMLGYGIGVLFA